MVILGKVLTGRVGRPRIRKEGMSTIAAAVEEAIGDRDIVAVATEWQVPRWVLDDLRRGKTKAPSSQYLSPVAKGLGMSIEAMLDLNRPTKRKAAASA